MKNKKDEIKEKAPVSFSDIMDMGDKCRVIRKRIPNENGIDDGNLNQA